MITFNQDNIYSQKYNYEELKTIAILAQLEESKELDYKDLACITKTIYQLWNNNNSKTNKENQKIYPWMEITNNEFAYIQNYTARIGNKIIKLYQKIKKEN